ncbi:MAG: transglutaminase domain-containing protein [Patescibacteria group bacterium]|nr:hypothetical protein [Patescibacteria group bacterium]
MQKYKTAQVQQNLQKHFLKFSPFTYPGFYQDSFESLPSNINKLGYLIRKQIIHPIVLSNRNLNLTHHGDMSKIPCYRQREEDNFQTVGAMLTELHRRDERGIILDQAVEDKLILSCRNVAILTASILKSKGIPARVRSGFAGYVALSKERNVDHWINQYWDKKKGRWVTIDIDACKESLIFDPFDIPKKEFHFAAETWLRVRNNSLDGSKFIHFSGYGGLPAIVEALFFDFHCLMNNEIIYVHFPAYLYGRLNMASHGEWEEIDELATLMLDPDKNFTQLRNLWKEKRKFRILKGGLL